MTRPAIVWRRAANQLLEVIASNLRIGDGLPSEQYMAEMAEGIRTSVTNALRHLYFLRVTGELLPRRISRLPSAADYLAPAKLKSGCERVSETLMERIYSRDLQPGGEFAKAELARAAMDVHLRPSGCTLFRAFYIEGGRSVEV